MLSNLETQNEELHPLAPRAGGAWGGGGGYSKQIPEDLSEAVQQVYSRPRRKGAKAFRGVGGSALQTWGWRLGAPGRPEERAAAAHRPGQWR